VSGYFAAEVPWMDFVLVALFAFRLTRLVTRDDIAHPLRTALSGLTDQQHADWRRLIEDAQAEGLHPWRDGIPARLVFADRSDLHASEPVTPTVRYWRWEVGVWVRCPWCVGTWLSLACGVGWAWLTPAGYSAGTTVGVAVAGIVGVVASLTD
jgi:hypothetical protein